LDIDGWLRGIGLGQYAEIFRANDIDGELLGRLTNGDLRDIGVASLGHRKKLLQAIAALASAPDAAPPIQVAALQPKTADASAERRHLTVMFCDLVGSTSISASLDAEDWRNLVSGYLDAASAAVTQMGGHVAKKLGDGIMALFGFPVAQENDSERAVRAALAIQRALADLNAHNAKTGAPELAARIGLDAGPVVVEPLGEVFGDAPNVAARVQAAAEPGAVLVTASVQRQTAGLFVAEDRGELQLRGVPAPVTLYRIVRASGGGRRGGARSRTPLVGREHELALIMGRWARTLQGEGQFVQIVGEPGLGKSRLIEEFHTRLADTPHTWVEWRSSQLLQNTPLHPIADWGRQRFGGADVAPERRLADLESSLAQVKLDPAEYVPLLAPLVDILLPPERTANLAPEELRRRQMAAILAWLTAGAHAQPIVLAFEDLQWADPTTLDVLRGLVERGALGPLLVLATTRPEFRAPWAVRSHHSTITLSPLDRAQIRQMVSDLAQRHALSRDVIEGVSERTGGVPLFIEEVTRLLLERGAQGGAQAIPPTLQQSLAARLDRLGPAREAAMIGAVLGRDFSFSLLRAVAGMDDAPLQAALDKLAEADILLVEGLPPDAEYRFKHALIQDAAYENLLKSRRQALHRRVAETLRDQFPERADAEPEALAHHFTQAGLDESAIEYWGKAGDQALGRSAFQEAIAHLGKAIEMADKAAGAAAKASANAPAPTDQRLKLQTRFGQAIAWTKGFAADEAKAALARAAELAVHADDSSERFLAEYGQWAACATGGELKKAEEIATKLLHQMEAAKRQAEVARVLGCLGLTCLYLGKLAAARSAHERVLADLSAPDRGQPLQNWADPGVMAGSHFALVAWLAGEPTLARRLIDQAKQRAGELDHIQTSAQALIARYFLETFRDDPLAALSSAERAIALAQGHGMEFFAAQGKVFSAWARSRPAFARADSAELRRAIADYVKLGCKINVPFLGGLLAEREAEGRDFGGAVATIGEALTLASETGERFTDAFLHRVRGDILLKADPANPVPAEEAYLAATAIAREQGARSFGLRAALSLAKLRQSAGRPLDAHDVLAPALEGFSATLEMPEIAEAQALLAALADTEEIKAAAAQRGAANFSEHTPPLAKSGSSPI
jgi:class 3 adenylate cyclase/predicted ATPase